MDFLDEEILEFKKSIKKNKFNTLESGMYIKDEIVHFTETEILGGKATIMLPDDFVDMPSNLAKIKYPSEQRPQIIKTSLDTGTNFTFSLFEIEFQPKWIKSSINQFKDLIQKVNPACVFYDMVVDEESAIGWFDFKSYGMDEQLYNIMYTMPIENKLMHGIFNCRFRDIHEWKEAALKVIFSIRDYTNEEEQYER